MIPIPKPNKYVSYPDFDLIAFVKRIKYRYPILTTRLTIRYNISFYDAKKMHKIFVDYGFSSATGNHKSSDYSGEIYCDKALYYYGYGLTIKLLIIEWNIQHWNDKLIEDHANFQRWFYELNTASCSYIPKKNNDCMPFNVLDLFRHMLTSYRNESINSNFFYPVFWSSVQDIHETLVDYGFSFTRHKVSSDWYDVPLSIPEFMHSNKDISYILKGIYIVIPIIEDSLEPWELAIDNSQEKFNKWYNALEEEKR